MVLPAPTLATPDRRMLALADILMHRGRIHTQKAFLEAIGLTKQAYWNIASGKQRFRAEAIERACAVFGVNANWIFGFSETVFRDCEAAQKSYL